MTKKTPIIGQQVFSLNVGNAARRKKQVLTPVIVTKVGRKYFTAMEEGRKHTETQYNLSNWRENTEYSAGSRLYESKQERADEIEEKELCRLIADYFEYGRNDEGISLKELREIAEILVGNRVVPVSSGSG